MMDRAASRDEPLRLGVSPCLLGEKVRYDGTDARDPFLAGVLARYVERVPICPEVEIGLPTPRPPIQLVGDPAAPRVLGQEDATVDVTDALIRLAGKTPLLDGFVFKSRSPSCGLGDAKISRRHGGPIRRKGTGLFALELKRAHPRLPVIDEIGLGHPERRENFLERLFAHRRWRLFLAENPDRADLRRFHAAHRLQLLTHGAASLRTLEAHLDDADIETYGDRFMATLEKRATPRRMARVLNQLLNRIKGRLTTGRTRAIGGAIADFVTGGLPLPAPYLALNKNIKNNMDLFVINDTFINMTPQEIDLRWGSLGAMRPGKPAAS